MPQGPGRRTQLTVTLTPQERQTLLAWQRATTAPAALARRGRILLLREAGMPIQQIAHAVGISRRCVSRWVRRFQAQGLAGLHDRPRRAFAHRRWRGETRGGRTREDPRHERRHAAAPALDKFLRAERRVAVDQEGSTPGPGGGG